MQCGQLTQNSRGQGIKSQALVSEILCKCTVPCAGTTVVYTPNPHYYPLLFLIYSSYFSSSPRPLHAPLSAIVSSSLTNLFVLFFLLPSPAPLSSSGIPFSCYFILLNFPPPPPSPSPYSSLSIPYSYLYILFTFPPPLAPFTLPFPLLSCLTNLFFLLFLLPSPPSHSLSSSSIPFSYLFILLTFPPLLAPFTLPFSPIVSIPFSC
jgi:hypothetical protein